MKVKIAYNTKQKDAIFKCLEDNKGNHMTAEDIYLTLKEKGTVVGIATIYRNLNSLVMEGAIKKFEVGNTACYQYVGDDCKNHYHLKCVNCNKVYHIELEALDEIEAEIKEKYNFDVDGAKLILYGRCKSCSD